MKLITIFLSLLMSVVVGEFQSDPTSYDSAESQAPPVVISGVDNVSDVIDDVDSLVSYACYLSIVEDEISIVADDIYPSSSSCFLCDMDNDGTEELVILDHQKNLGEYSLPGYVYSVYDVENGNTVAKIDHEVLLYDIAGPQGNISAANFLGDTVFVVYYDNGETGSGAHRGREYTIYDTTDFQIITTRYLDYITDYGTEDGVGVIIDYLINGEPCSYDDYYNFVSFIEPVVTAEIYSNDSTDGSMELYELQQLLREALGITVDEPEQTPESSVSPDWFDLPSNTEPDIEPDLLTDSELSEQELIGTWVLDSEYTMNYNGVSLTYMYGSSIKYGNLMTFSSDGYFSYYISFYYGSGTYTLYGNEIYVNLTDGDSGPGEMLLYVSNDGITRIAFDQYGDGNLVFWAKE